KKNQENKASVIAGYPAQRSNKIPLLSFQSLESPHQIPPILALDCSLRLQIRVSTESNSDPTQSLMGEPKVTTDGGSTSGESSRTSSKLLTAGDRKLLKVELQQGETTYVSWKKLMKEASKGNGLSVSAPDPPPNANPNLESRIAPGPPAEGEKVDQPHSNRFNAVIEKIERLYMGKDSSDGEELDGAPPDDDQYDTEDSFIDDVELDEYFEVDDSAIKHDGFFVNRGKLERIEPTTTTTSNQQPKKRQRKESAKPCGDVVDVSRKQAKMAKTAGGKDQLAASGPSSKKKSNDSKAEQDSVSPLKPQSGNDCLLLENVKHTDRANHQPRNASSPKSKAAGSSGALLLKCSKKSAHQQSNSLPVKSRPNVLAKSTVVRQKETNGMHELDNATKKSGSSVRPKTSTLEKAIRELEKVVAESRPPAATENQDADTSSQAVKRRLPRDVKLKLAKVARIAASQGNVSGELINRLMSIVGHLIQVRSLKRNLKIMIDSGDTANREKDTRFQRIKNEVIEMLKTQVPLMESQATNQEAGTSDDFQDVGSVEKPPMKKKFVMDAALEDKLCDLYDIFVDGLDEDSGPQIRKLYANLAELWPNRLMDNHEIKRAICRAKERRRALYGNLGKEMDQGKMTKRKQTQLVPKVEAAAYPDKASAVGDKTNVVPSSTTTSLGQGQPSADRSKQQHEKLKGTTSASNSSAEAKTVRRKTEPGVEESHLSTEKGLVLALRQQTQAPPDLNLPKNEVLSPLYKLKISKKSSVRVPADSRILVFSREPRESLTESERQGEKCAFRFPAAMKTTQLFKGANVFMSRSLVPPEVFDTLLDACTLNGAEIFLCCDPSRSGPCDFHVIASPDHEKFEDLKAKGCNLIGPQCVLSCAKEGRPLPQGGFNCCLAMDGLKVLASGFKIDEKVKIEELVTSMGGVFVSRGSSDVNFVIVKNVLASKYKWALDTHKKPVVALNWLQQCWIEHRVVPQEPYKIPPFSGLTICVTKIPADERKEMEKRISEYGGRYSAELTKRCDKYKVARKWGHIQIVTRKWFQQSIARKVCLSEEAYPVQDSIPLSRGVRNLGSNYGQEKFPGCPISLSSSAATAAADSYASYPQSRDSDIEASASQKLFSTSMNPSIDVKKPSKGPTTEPQEQNIDDCTARDSESEDNDLYLSDCRIFLLGFEASEMRRLVKLVRGGGGSRYMTLSERMTHIVVGTPSESEKREARAVAASGVVQVVTPRWLEDCDRQKKEIPIHKVYTAHNLILPRDAACLTKGSLAGMEQGKNTIPQTMTYDSSSRSVNVPNEAATLLGKNKEAMLKLSRKDEIHVERKIESLKQKETMNSLVTNNCKKQQKIQCEFNGQNKQERKSSVFKGKTFCFSHSFPEDRRPEIVEWVNQGEGEVVNDPFIHNTHFTIECHGVFRSTGTSQTIYVSSHWVRSCLEDGCLLDVSSHILYSPLPCQTPLPGFESLRFCASQYEEKEKVLLRNLCFVLGAKFGKNLSRKMTHLLCIFATGDKYEAASRWGIVSVTSDWIYECVRQNRVVCPDNFHPKELTTQDQDAGLGLASQFHTQFASMASRDNGSLLGSHSEDREKTQSFAGKYGCGKGEVNNRLEDIGREQSFPSKKAKLLGDGQESDVFPVGEHPSHCARPLKPIDSIVSGSAVASGREVPDVADTIEDLLKQSSKIQEKNSPGRISEKTLFSTSEPYNSGNHSVTGLSRHWINRVLKNDDACNPPGDVTTGTYGNFSETQTESQVVGYEEDLSGRQMLIDRVRTRSSLT
ncbi:unnamed protein product, partial [Thlaspi arvense]